MITWKNYYIESLIYTYTHTTVQLRPQNISNAISANINLNRNFISCNLYKIYLNFGISWRSTVVRPPFSIISNLERIKRDWIGIKSAIFYFQFDSTTEARPSEPTTDESAGQTTQLQSVPTRCSIPTAAESRLQFPGAAQGTRHFLPHDSVSQLTY